MEKLLQSWTCRGSMFYIKDYTWMYFQHLVKIKISETSVHGNHHVGGDNASQLRTSLMTQLFKHNTLVKSLEFSKLVRASWEQKSLNLQEDVITTVKSIQGRNVSGKTRNCQRNISDNLSSWHVNSYFTAHSLPVSSSSL